MRERQDESSLRGQWLETVPNKECDEDLALNVCYMGGYLNAKAGICAKDRIVQRGVRRPVASQRLPDEMRSSIRQVYNRDSYTHRTAVNTQGCMTMP